MEPRATGQADEGRFVCPWCGGRFPQRHVADGPAASLEGHWLDEPECAANRNVNNPTQSKYVGPEDGERA